MRNYLMRIYLAFVIILVMVTVAAVIYGLRGTTNQTTHIYLLPQSYTGWVEITYNQPDSPELDREGDDYVYVIPDTGELRTSSSEKAGPMVLYYVDEHGNRTELAPGMVHAQGVTSGSLRQPDGTVREVTVNRFFVGTEQEWQQHEAIGASAAPAGG